MNLIVVGAGGTTRDLLRGLGELWRVTLVDSDPQRLHEAARVRTVTSVVGDGSSKVVLDRAGLQEAHALVAASKDDAVNLEACRLAREAGLLRVVGVAADPERLPEYRSLGVTVVSPDRLSARRVEINLEPGRVSSAAFADGWAEAIEFRVRPESAVRGRMLRDLHSESWLVAAILREGTLIIPHGDTVLEAGDLVTVVGAASDHAEMVRLFTSGEVRFPAEYGSRIAVALDTVEGAGRLIEECTHLARHSGSDGLIVFRWDEAGGRLPEEPGSEGVVQVRSVEKSPSRALVGGAHHDGVALVVLSNPDGAAYRGRLAATRLLRRLATQRLPFLLAAGSHPYQRIVVPARDTPAGRAAARAAVDLAASMSIPLAGVAVVPPTFIAGEEARDEAHRAIASLRERAAIQGVAMERHPRQGNPVREIEAVMNDTDLLVLGRNKGPTPWNLGVVGHLVRRARISVLLVPAET